MAADYLHHHRDFKDLIMIVSEEKGNPYTETAEDCIIPDSRILMI